MKVRTRFEFKFVFEYLNFYIPLKYNQLALSESHCCAYKILPHVEDKQV